MSEPSSKLRNYPATILLLLAASTLRIFRLAYHSIWWDEAHSIQVAREGLASVLALPGTYSWNHPPLHYGALVGWIRLAGDSEFSMRYLSVLAGLVVVAVAYRLGARLLGRRAALAGMAIAAVSPLYVVYSQEARVYALLPALYLWLVYEAQRLALADQPPPFKQWTLLALAETVLLLAHYVTVLGVLYVNLFLVTAWLWRRRFRLRDWLASQLLALALYAPWLVVLARHADFIRGQLGQPDYEAVRPSLLTYLQQVWHFIASGSLVAPQAEPLLARSLTLLAVIFGAGLLLTLSSQSRRQKIALLLAHTAGPLALGFALWQVWPQAQPRYLIAFTLPLWLALGWMLATLWRSTLWRNMAGSLLAFSAALAFGLSLNVQYFEEAYHKDDNRSVAAYLESVTQAGDVVLISPNDFSLPYYYNGPARLVMAAEGGFEARYDQLAQLAPDAERIIVVRWKPSNNDLQDLRGYLLERAGHLEEWRDYRGLDARVYALDDTLPDLPQPDEVTVDFGPLTLTGAMFEAESSGGAALAVALQWEATSAMDAPYKVSVTLIDTQGQQLSAVDLQLYDEENRPTYAMQAGDRLTSFYVVPVPAGTPPGEAQLGIVVYDAHTLERLTVDGGEATEAVIGKVMLTPDFGELDDPYGTLTYLSWHDLTNANARGWVPPPQIGDLTLTKFALEPPEGLPGQPQAVWLRWEATADVEATETPVVRLLNRDDEELVEVGGEPLAMQTGQILIERREYLYPAVTDSLLMSLVTDEGQHQLAFTGLDNDALWWRDSHPPIPYRLTAQFGDFARLRGFDLERTRLLSGEPFTLTLYWEGLDGAPTDRNYTVFTQLLTPDGRVIAQHDGPPLKGSRPTLTWLDGEILVDEHTLVFLDDTYSGLARLVVGLYDSETIERVLTASGADHVIVSDALRVR